MDEHNGVCVANDGRCGDCRAALAVEDGLCVFCMFEREFPTVELAASAVPRNPALEELLDRYALAALPAMLTRHNDAVAANKAFGVALRCLRERQVILDGEQWRKLVSGGCETEE